MTIDLSMITKENFFMNLGPEKKPWHSDYLIMYSSWFNGFVTDPELMLVPCDDHLVHRGDGVFDVMRCINGKIYQMDKTGIMHIFRPDKVFTPIAEPNLGEGSVCTPAFADGRIYIRGNRNLYCIGK